MFFHCSERKRLHVFAKVAEPVVIFWKHLQEFKARTLPRTVRKLITFQRKEASLSFTAVLNTVKDEHQILISKTHSGKKVVANILVNLL